METDLKNYKTKKYFSGVGSRSTPSNICEGMTAITVFLSRKNYILRSGGADGADIAFEKGVKEPSKKEIWLPWLKFNGNFSKNLPSPVAFEIAKEYHPVWNKLSQGSQKLYARNVHQILGKDLQTPSEFCICWTEDGTPKGGTRTVILIALDWNIPVYNLFNPSDKEKLKEFLSALASKNL